MRLYLILSVSILLGCFASRSSLAEKPDTPATFSPTVFPLDADTRRKSDLSALKKAVESYAKKNGGSFRVRGAGAAGEGSGYITRAYGPLPSIASVLLTAGLLKTLKADDGSLPNYMIFVCENETRFSISATLDRPSTAEIDQLQKSCNADGPEGTLSLQKNYAVGN